MSNHYDKPAANIRANHVALEKRYIVVREIKHLGLRYESAPFSHEEATKRLRTIERTQVPGASVEMHEVPACDRCGITMEASSVCNACGEVHEGHVPSACPSCKADALITVWGEDQLQRWRDGSRHGGPDRVSTDDAYDGARCDSCRGIG